MSAEYAPTPSRQHSRPVRILRGLPQTAARTSTLPFIVAMAVILAVGIVAALVLNTQIQDQSVRISQQNTRIAELSHQESALSAQVDRLRSPAHLQVAAQELGMVPNPYPVFVDLRSGKIVGKATPVVGYEVPGVTGSSKQAKLVVPDAKPGSGAAQR